MQVQLEGPAPPTPPPYGRCPEAALGTQASELSLLSARGSPGPWGLPGTARPGFSSLSLRW